MFVQFAVGLLLLATGEATPFNEELDTRWEQFKVQSGRHYGPLEEEGRRLLWEQTVNEVESHNKEADKGLYSYRLAVNHRADMRHDEFLTTVTGARGRGSHSGSGSSFVPYSNVQVPDSVDWRQKGCVTGVKDLGQCGASWAFSAVGSLECQNKRKTGKLVALSEQNLEDCVVPGRACTGEGDVRRAFEYVMKNGGIDTAEGYPDPSKTGQCKFNPDAVGATCTGYVDLPSGDEEALKQAVALVGPVATYVDASQFSFQMYTSGVYNEPLCSSTTLDLSVLVVGYGSLDGEDYWLVENWWGPNWGVDGYIMMARNKGNQCGIATNASYPLV